MSIWPILFYTSKKNIGNVLVHLLKCSSELFYIYAGNVVLCEETPVLFQKFAIFADLEKNLIGVIVN